jgi:hypothetical protein
MSLNIVTVATEKSKITGISEGLWLQSIESARQSLRFRDIDSASLIQIADASRSPENFTLVVRLMYQYSKLHPFDTPVGELLFYQVNRSPFSLSDWIDAIAFFYAWLVDQERSVDFSAMLNYLDCCAASSDARESGQNFSTLLEGMLRVFGFVG